MYIIYTYTNCLNTQVMYVYIFIYLHTCKCRLKIKKRKERKKLTTFSSLIIKSNAIENLTDGSIEIGTGKSIPLRSTLS